MSDFFDEMMAAAKAGLSPEGSCACGAGALEKVWRNDKVVLEEDGEAIEVRIPFMHCAACDMSFSHIEAEAIRHAAVCKHLGLLAPNEIKAIRESLGMSRRVFDEAFGIPPASMERWENGRLIQNRSMDTLLRAIVNPATATRVDRRVKAAKPVASNGNVIFGRFGALAAAPDAARESAMARRDSFRLQA